MKYKCIKELVLPKFDDDGLGTLIVDVGSVWNDTTDRFIDGKISLENGDLIIAEIPKKILKVYFGLLEQDA